MPSDPRPVMVITGSSKGVGYGTALHFLAKGYLVAGCSRGESTISDPGYLHCQVDIGNEVEVRRWVRFIKNSFGRIDVLICNAAVFTKGSLLTMTSGETIHSMMVTNVVGTFVVCREVAKVMMMQKSGRIITVSSVLPGVHAEGTSAYSASKSAIVEMTKILAKEIASLGVTCNVVAPGLVLTDSIKAMGPVAGDRVLEIQTINRPTTISDICNVVSFFAAPESSMITGQVLYLGLVD